MLVRLNEKHPFMIFSKACSRSYFLWNLKGPEREIMGHKSLVFEEKYLLEQVDCSWVFEEKYLSEQVDCSLGL